MTRQTTNAMTRSVQKSRNKRNTRRNTSATAVGEFASDAWSLAKRTAYGLNEIRKLINIETKILPTTGTFSAGMDTTGTVFCLTRIAQGLDYTNRIGDSIKLQRLEFRYRVSMTSTAARTFGRVILLRDLDGYGTAPGVTDVLETASVLAPKRYLNSERFSILYDELLALSQNGDSCSVGVVDMTHEGHVKYLGTTAAAASDGKGSIYCLIISNETTTTIPSFTYDSRIYFTDD